MRLAALALAGIMFAVTAIPAMAASDEQDCIAAGGTYEKVGSISTCAFPVGNSDNVKTDTQKGDFNSSHPKGYVNPGGNLPPGQQE